LAWKGLPKLAISRKYATSARPGRVGGDARLAAKSSKPDARSTGSGLAVEQEDNVFAEIKARLNTLTAELLHLWES
jgi:hypothetical protein